MAALFIELVLQFQTFVVRFHRADCPYDGVYPALQVGFALLLGSGGSVAGIVIGESRVPPDASVDIVREFHTLLVGAGFVPGPIYVNQVRAGDEHVGGFGFAGMPVRPLLLSSNLLCGFVAPWHVNDIIMRRIELRLGEIRKQVLGAAVAIDNEDFLAAVARHFIGSGLEKLHLQFGVVSDGAGFVASFGDLAKIVLGKNDGVFLLRGMFGDIADVEEVGANRQMRSVFFEYPERKQAGAL